MKNQFHILIYIIKMWRKYKIRENYFSNIDTRMKSYFVGLLLSDGSVYKYQIKITLIEKDKYILEKLKDEIFIGNGPALYFLPLNLKNINHQNVYSLTICSKKMCEDLSKFGIIPNKTLKVKLPEINDDLFFDFLRGYFDGDGSLYYRNNRNNSLIWQITGTFEFLTSLKNKIQSKLNFKIGIYKTSSSEVFEIKISNKESVLKLCDKMYAKPEFFLNRKKEKFDKFKLNYKPVLQYSNTKGITFDKSRNKWKAQFYFKGINYNLGRFNTEQEAIKKLNEFRKEN